MLGPSAQQGDVKLVMLGLDGRIFEADFIGHACYEYHTLIVTYHEEVSKAVFCNLPSITIAYYIKTSSTT